MELFPMLKFGFNIGEPSLCHCAVDPLRFSFVFPFASFVEFGVKHLR